MSSIHFDMSCEYFMIDNDIVTAEGNNSFNNLQNYKKQSKFNVLKQGLMFDDFFKNINSQFVNRKNMEKQEYRQYFFRNKKKPSSVTIYNQYQKPKISKTLHINHQKKTLPHITEEFEFKTTNQLLLTKILNPKRDKLMTQVFQKTFTRPLTRHVATSLGKPLLHSKHLNSFERQKDIISESQQGQHGSKHRRKLKLSVSKQKSKVKKLYGKQFILALQNKRMGLRIINTKSSVEQSLKKTYFTYKSPKQYEKENMQPQLKNSYIRGKQNAKIFFSGKINNGVKAFFNPIKNDDSSFSKSQLKNSLVEEQNQSSSKFSNHSSKFKTQQELKEQNYHPLEKTTDKRKKMLRKTQIASEISQYLETHCPDSFKIFGSGPTILLLYDLEIVSNPAIKDDSLLILELITHQKRLSPKRNKEKAIRTTPISYQFLKTISNSNCSNCVRFAINASQIGDFVPLRIYKVVGVEIHQLGIIDIDLTAYRYQRAQFSASVGNDTFCREYKIGRYGQKYERNIISGSIDGNLRRNRVKRPILTFISMNYKLYPKKYKTCEQLIK